MKRYLYILLALATLIAIYYKSSSSVKDKEQEKTQSITNTPEELNNSQSIQAETEQKKLFSDTPSGKSLSKILELYSDLDAPDSENGKIAHAEIQKLYDTPNQAFEEIKKSVSSLPKEKEMPKQFLLQLSALLNVEKNEKLTFLDKAFKETLNIGSTSTNYQARRTPVIVFETYCRVSEDKDLCGKLLSESIDSAPKDIQIPLLNVYKILNPDGAKELAKKMGINSYW